MFDVAVNFDEINYSIKGSLIVYKQCGKWETAQFVDVSNT